MKKIVHKDWLKLKNEMTIRMGYKTIDMCFLLKFYDYIDNGFPVWEHEEKRDIVLKEQIKTKEWQEYCKKIEVEQDKILQAIEQSGLKLIEEGNRYILSKLE